jgi:acyl carrier protein
MEEKVISIIAKVLNVPTSDITPDTEIGEPDEWDSLHNLTIFTELEKTFNVKITQEMMMDLEDVSDIINLLEEIAK